MKLYNHWRSSASYRVRIILHHKGLPWDYVPIALFEGEQHSEDFRKTNPMGLVPVLDTGEAVIAQSPAIAEYLEDRHPEPPLLPPDAVGRARVREMVHTIGCDIHPIQNLRILRFLQEEYQQDEDGVVAWCQRWISDGFEAFERLAKERSSRTRFSHGDELSLADVWLIPQLNNARRVGVDLSPFPTIQAIARHCESLEAFIAAHPSRQPDAPDA